MNKERMLELAEIVERGTLLVDGRVVEFGEPRWSQIAAGGVG